MKRAVMFLAAGVLIFGSALSAKAQAPTVSFGGQMRVFGFAFDNITDFKDTAGTANKDSQSFFFQRFRLFTTIESADKKAKAYWALEIGDIFWGNGGGASGNEFCPGCPAAGQTAPGATAVSGSSRVGNGSGGGFGNDGVNVETKNIYLWFEVPGLPNASLLLGIHNVLFLTSPVGAFMDDDAAGIQFNWKADPIDLQLSAIKLNENTTANPDDNDMYMVRFGLNLTKDTRVTVEGMVLNTQCLARRVGAGGPNTGTCISADPGDSFWIGATAATKLGTISLDGTFVYGERTLSCFSPACGVKNTAVEKGYGFQATARFPVGPLNMWVHGWYTSGDESRPISPAGNGSGSTNSFGPLAGKSDKLPLPDSGASWGGAPFIAEWILGLPSIGAPAPGGGTTVLYDDYSGSYGVGASGIYALTPQLSLGAGAAFVGATETKAVCPSGVNAVTGCPAGAGNVFGDHVFTVDVGAYYQLNANLSIRALAGYLIPDKGDDAWGLVFRTQYSF